MSYSYRSTPSEYRRGYYNSNEEGYGNEENGNNSYSGPNRNNMKNIKPVGKGTYGLILSPALSNLKANGTTEKFPDMVTKLYFDKSSLKQAINSGNKIYELTGNEGHKLSNYTYKYKTRNINKTLKGKLRNMNVNIDNIYNHTKPMPMARMKNLGIDMRHKILTGAIAKLSEIPAATLLEQVLKVMKQIEIFVSTNYIHGDVRPPNMMINPDTGVITIIDFDLFEPVPAFMKNNVAFYNRPPENYISDIFSDPYGILKLTELDYVRALIGGYRINKDKYTEYVKAHYAYIVDKIKPISDILAEKVNEINETPANNIPANLNKIEPLVVDILDHTGDQAAFKERIVTHDYCKNEYITSEKGKAFNLFTMPQQRDMAANIYPNQYNLDHYIIYNNQHNHRVGDELTKAELIEVLQHNTQIFVEKYLVGKGHAIETVSLDTIRSEWNKMILPYFDAFGLATSLLELITTVDYKDPIIISLRDNVLKKMVEWKIDERIDIFEAVKRVEAIIATAAEKPKEADASVNNAVAAAVAAAKAALAAAAPAKSPHANAVAAAKAALAAAAGKAGGRRPRKTVRRRHHSKKSKRHSTRSISRR